jgi:hypothetical protein
MVLHDLVYIAFYHSPLDRIPDYRECFHEFMDNYMQYALKICDVHSGCR